MSPARSAKLSCVDSVILPFNTLTLVCTSTISGFISHVSELFF